MSTNKTTTNRLPILCLDFDGVIHSYVSGWQGADVIPDPPVPGALEFLGKATEKFEVHIFSSRSTYPDGIKAMSNWLWKAVTGEDYDPDATVDIPVWLLKIKFPTYKPAASISIDDRAITFTGVFPPLEELLAFRPWNKLHL